MEIQLERVETLLIDRGYRLEISEQAEDYLVEVGYDPDYGARPLKRAIQRYLQDPLALEILAGRFNPGETIAVDRGPEGLIFTPVLEAEVVS